MNITRKIDNNKFFYYYKNKLITNKNIIENINKIRIPPGYNNVKINENFDDDILAIGEDSAGRKQYMYNKNYIEEQSEIKFCDLINFGRKIKKIRKDINDHINREINNFSKEDIIYMALYLIDNCNFRIGSKKYKELYNSYGVTTLNSKHFKFLKNYVRIEFIGKKGVLNKSVIKNKNVMYNLGHLCSTYRNQEFIFSYDFDGKLVQLSDKVVNSFLQQKYHKSLTVKMFRTWNANNILLREIIDLEAPRNTKDAENNINKIVKKVANKLHHTPNVSKKSYINNELLNLYKNDFKIFYNILKQFIETKSKFPSIDRLLNIFLEYLCNLHKK